MDAPKSLGAHEQVFTVAGSMMDLAQPVLDGRGLEFSLTRSGTIGAARMRQKVRPPSAAGGLAELAVLVEPWQSYALVSGRNQGQSA